MGKTWPWLWPLRRSQAREGNEFNASTLGLAPCQRDKGGGRGTSFQLGPVKIGLFVLHRTRVQLEWLEVATMWHLGDTDCLDCLEDAIQSVAWTLADLGCRTSPPPSLSLVPFRRLLFRPLKMICPMRRASPPSSLCSSLEFCSPSV